MLEWRQRLTEEEEDEEEEEEGGKPVPPLLCKLRCLGIEVGNSLHY